MKMTQPEKTAVPTSACWVETCNGYVPPGATMGVITKHFGAAYVARAEHNNVWLPGVLISSYGHCLVTSDGVQHRKTLYQVLCNAGEVWVHMHSGIVLPQDAMPVGYTEEDGVQYFGRVTIQGVTVLGKILKRDRRCYVYHQKTEKCFLEYEILTVPLTIQKTMPAKAIQQMPAVNQKYKIDNRQPAVINAGEKSKQTPSVVALNGSVTPLNSYTQRSYKGPQPQQIFPPQYRGSTPVLQYSSIQTQQGIGHEVSRKPKYTPGSYTRPHGFIHPSSRAPIFYSHPNMYPASMSPQPIYFPTEEGFYVGEIPSPPQPQPQPKSQPQPQPQQKLSTRFVKPEVVNKERWVASSKGKFPPGAVVGGKNHLGPIYVGRVKHEGSWLPGKLIPGYGRCYITSQGQEVHSKEYEVLCDGVLSWEVTKSGGKITDLAVPGGYDKNATYFIGRVAHGGSVTTGKVDSTSRKCYVLYGGVEHSYDEYELLVGDPPNEDMSATIRVPASIAPVAAPKPEEDFKLIPLPPTDKDYISVNKMMQSSIRTHSGRATFTKYEILKMERVWNKTVWKRFMHCRERVMQENNNNANEKELFHGSANCDDIVKKGFDERHSKISGMFGAGVYFAEHSSKSNQYTKTMSTGSTTCRQMLLCRVILGKVSEYTSAQNTLAHAPPGCHSVKGVPQSGLIYPEYIVYRGEQAFPKFLITYKIVQ